MFFTFDFASAFFLPFMSFMVNKLSLKVPYKLSRKTPNMLSVQHVKSP